MQNQQSLLDDVSPEVELARQRRAALTAHIAERTAVRNQHMGLRSPGAAKPLVIDESDESDARGIASSFGLPRA